MLELILQGLNQLILILNPNVLSYGPNIKLDFKTHTIINLHGKRTRQCGTVMPGNGVQALQPTGNNVPASLQNLGK